MIKYMFSFLVKRQKNKTILLVKPKTTHKQLEDLLKQSQITNEQIKKLHNILRSQSLITKLDFTNLSLVIAQYIAIKPTAQDYFNILSQPLQKNIDPKYVYQFALMADDFLTNFQITHYQNYQILNSLNFGFRIISNGDINDTFGSSLLPRSQEIFIIKLFFKICDRIMTDQYKNSMILACKIMKGTRMWHKPLLDKINQELILFQVPLETKIIYLQTLIRSGQQIFPEPIYQLRDELLTIDLLKIDPKQIHQLFDIFVRSRLQLNNAILGKLMLLIIDQFHILSHHERLSFVFMCSKYQYQPHSVLKDMIFDLTQNVKGYNAIAMKMFFLCLYNIDYKDEDFFNVLKSQINLKDKVQQILSSGKFNEKELRYFNQIGQIN